MHKSLATLLLAMAFPAAASIPRQQADILPEPRLPPIPAATQRQMNPVYWIGRTLLNPAALAGELLMRGEGIRVEGIALRQGNRLLYARGYTIDIDESTYAVIASPVDCRAFLHYAGRKGGIDDVCTFFAYESKKRLSARFLFSREGGILWNQFASSRQEIELPELVESFEAYGEALECMIDGMLGPPPLSGAGP